MKINIIIRLILWFILAGITGWFLYMGIVPGGKITYITDFSEDNFFISNLTPKERVDNQSSNLSREIGTLVIGDPIYFTLRTPRRFDRAKLTTKYKIKETGIPASGADLINTIEAGILVDKIIWRYDLKPIENRTIDRLGMVWDVTRDNGLILLQKEKKFDSIDDFINSTTSIDKIAVYNYDLDREYILLDYKAGAVEKKLSSEVSELSSFSALRGAWQLYTYIKDEELDFRFTFFDLNKNKDHDSLDIHLYYEDALIDSRHLNDDGNFTDNGEKSGERELELKLDNLPEGVYKIEFRANDDIITEKIETAQSKAAFINKVRFFKAGNTFITLWTDSKAIRAKTIHPDSLQTLGVGVFGLELKETYKQYEINIGTPLSTSTIAVIFIDKDGVEINGDGVFSFSESAYVNSRIMKVDNKLDVIGEGIQYVIAEYNGPQKSGEWRVAEVKFDLNRAYREDGKYSFIISIPGLNFEDEIDDAIQVGEIKVELLGKTLWEKIKTFIK